MTTTPSDPTDVQDTVLNVAPVGSPRKRLGSKSSNDQRKTVTFGDASAIRSKPFWSLVSLVLILAFWWFSTTAFGFPEEFKGQVDEQFQLAATAQNLRKLAKLVPQPTPTG